jgi:hypothetical protein
MAESKNNSENTQNVKQHITIRTQLSQAETIDLSIDASNNDFEADSKDNFLIPDDAVDAIFHPTEVMSYMETPTDKLWMKRLFLDKFLSTIFQNNCSEFFDATPLINNELICKFNRLVILYVYQKEGKVDTSLDNTIEFNVTKIEELYGLLPQYVIERYPSLNDLISEFNRHIIEGLTKTAEEIFLWRNDCQHISQQKDKMLDHSNNDFEEAAIELIDYLPIIGIGQRDNSSEKIKMSKRSMTHSYTITSNYVLDCLDLISMTSRLTDQEISLIRRCVDEFGTISAFGNLFKCTTEIDDTVRISKEMLPEHYHVSEDFISDLTNKIQETWGHTVMIIPEKLIIYEKGGFFKQHCDTLKHPRMLGTLVHILNTEFTGGYLHIDEYHYKQSNTFFFMAETEHSIGKITSDIPRISLTFSIIAPEGGIQFIGIPLTIDIPPSQDNGIGWKLYHHYSTYQLENLAFFAKGCDRYVYEFMMSNPNIDSTSMQTTHVCIEQYENSGVYEKNTTCVMALNPREANIVAVFRNCFPKDNDEKSSSIEIEHLEYDDETFLSDNKIPIRSMDEKPNRKHISNIMFLNMRFNDYDKRCISTIMPPYSGNQYEEDYYTQHTYLDQVVYFNFNEHYVS